METLKTREKFYLRSLTSFNIKNSKIPVGDQKSFPTEKE